MGFCNLDTEAAVAESDAINGVDRFECDSIQFGNGKSFSWKTSWAIIITRLSNPIHLQIRLIFPQDNQFRFPYEDLNESISPFQDAKNGKEHGGGSMDG